MTSSRTRLIVLYMSLLLLSDPFCHCLLKRSITRSLHSKRTFHCNFSTETVFTESSSLRMAQQNPPMLVVIAGPTASGKSDVAAKLCAHQQGMIVSADSVQAYRGVQIGANKPTAQEREETPHILIDVANHEESYNAAEWRDDAIFCIRNLLLEGADEDSPDASTTPQTLKRRREILDYIQQSRVDKGWGKDFSVLPVICGGTMMYIEWLVHGRPDACRPTPSAVKESYKIIEHFQKEKNYQGAVDTVSSFGKVFADRTQQFCGDDWYRLRRTLEIALTMQEQATAADDNQDSNDPAKVGRQKGTETMLENLYSGQRHGGLATLGYDVRCFFLCPDDRMSHTRVVDERCEQMIVKGLIKETADLKLSGCLPEMAERAIGYRQTLDYLFREIHADETEEIMFDSFVHDFTTATRRYAKKQMSWFRKDKEFMFVTVPLKLDKSVRVDTITDEIIKYCQLSRAQYDAFLFDEESKNASCKKENELQGKAMKFYQFQRRILKSESKAYLDVLTEAVECRERMRISGTRKRGIEETFQL